ncbi:MAG TPA: 2-oxoglutarate dehydrogenase, E2 component, dihydrolipoamide succinyltransferase, partial [Candidatus Limnocylindrales bacterium]|nr:2-oxoglutarate dehydrogenase, E2 component, dihydrolipoamide succinyltransferase [Candidatus Limnocylindrales bacterium]
PVSVTMPRLGESVTEGTVTRWLKQEGDRVEVDEPLLEVSTDKVDTEIPSPAAGVLQKILVAEDETAEVGSQLAIIGEGESAPAAEAPPAQEAQAATPAAEAPGEAPPAQETPAPAAEQEPAPAQQPAPARQPAPAAQGGGATPVKMPALGESVTEGTVTRWLKSVGDQVEADEPLLEVSTDKVDTEIPSPVAGTLLEITVPEDETVAVGAQLALIGAAGAAPAQPQEAPKPPPEQEEAPKPAAEQEEPKPVAEQEEPKPVAEQPRPAAEQPKPEPAPEKPKAVQEPVAATAEPADGYVTPLVRKLAQQHNVDLASVTGTGVGGRIRKQDVLDAAEKAKAPKAEPAAPAREPVAPSPLRGRTEKLPRLRMTIAKRMVESLQVSAQLTTVVEVDVTRMAKLRDQAKKDFQATHGVKLSYLPFFALATVEALRQFPNVNASMDMEAGTVTYHDGEHLGMAVDTEKGLIVPVIRNAGDLNLAGLAKRIADVADRTRTNKITPDELSGGTFTITNTGSRGALFDTPIINQPQVAILGTGAVVKRAIVIDDPDLGEAIVPRYMVYLALSYDHRLVDGADAARFLSAIKDRLEGGNFEAELGL